MIASDAAMVRRRQLNRLRMVTVLATIFSYTFLSMRPRRAFAIALAIVASVAAFVVTGVIAWVIVAGVGTFYVAWMHGPFEAYATWDGWFKVWLQTYQPIDRRAFRALRELLDSGEERLAPYVMGFLAKESALNKRGEVPFG